MVEEAGGVRDWADCTQTLTHNFLLRLGGHPCCVPQVLGFFPNCLWTFTVVLNLQLERTENLKENIYQLAHPGRIDAVAKYLFLFLWLS